MIFYVVIHVQTNEFIFCCDSKQVCHGHVNHAIDCEIEDSELWVVREAVLKAGDAHEKEYITRCGLRARVTGVSETGMSGVVRDSIYTEWDLLGVCTNSECGQTWNFDLMDYQAEKR